jgi:hypothetical protein
MNADGKPMPYPRSSAFIGGLKWLFPDAFLILL